MMAWGTLPWGDTQRIDAVRQMLDRVGVRHPNRVAKVLKQNSAKDRDSFHRAKRLVHWAYAWRMRCGGVV